MIYPLPAAMISCGTSEEEYNILTISWMGTICTNPPMCYISVRPERHSYEIIKRTGEFVINLTNEELAYAADWCGVKSGKNVNKFEEMKLTPVKGEMINAPIIKESPLCIECKVKEIIPLGSHHMFIADVLNVQADARFINEETDKFDIEKAILIAYSHGHYYKLGEEIGRFGWTVKKK
ncbi:MAG: flavin reductase family protein [Paludibacteraceae bacterium]